MCVDRFYYLADWEDEYCDLTLDKMVNETAKLGRNIVRTLQTPEDIDSLRKYLKAHYEVGNGNLMEYKVKTDLDQDTKPGFFKRIRTVALNFLRKENS